MENAEILAEIVYDAYKNHLNSRIRQWRALRNQPEHENKSAEAFDQWLKDHKSDELTRYFMGDFAAMPGHTQLGWKEFAAQEERGAEAAWRAYTEAAQVNYHRNSAFVLPGYLDLDPDQQDALISAIQALKDYKAERNASSFIL